MTVHFTYQNLFDVNADCLVVPTNCEGAMGAGIARVFRDRYPDMYWWYKELCQKGMHEIGRPAIWRNPEVDGPDILCMPTKVRWRHPSNLQYIKMGLSRLVEKWDKVNVESIVFPALGCGHGGLKWMQVRPVMEDFLTQIPAEVYICTPGN